MQLLQLIKSDKTIHLIISIGVCIVFVFTIVFLWNDYEISFSKKINAEKFAQFGDFVGGVVGSIWALAGIFLFYKALTEQREDFRSNREALGLQVEALNHQIEEFKQNRIELVNSRKVYEEQSRILRIQQFETGFYSMLEVYKEIKNKIDFIELKELIDNKKGDNKKTESIHLEMVELYCDVYLSNREKLSHFYRMVYRLVNTVDSTDFLTCKEKYSYMKLLRAQYTDFEMVLLYYNSHTVYGEKFRPLILKYNLLKHIPFFIMPEFKFFLEEQRNNKVIMFFEEIDKFLVKHLPALYDVGSEIDRMEEKFNSFDVIVGVYIESSIIIKIRCSCDINENGINLSDIRFQDFISTVLYSKINFCQYKKSGSLNLKKQLVTSERYKEFCFIINSDQSIELNKDEF